MATTQETSDLANFATTSYDTALCIIPSEQACRSLDSLRLLYDKSYGKWPPHVNLIYPFVAPESLPRAKAQIEEYLRSCTEAMPRHLITLDRAGFFEHRNSSTVFLQENENSANNTFSTIRSLVLKSLGNDTSPANFHLTVGQADDDSQSTREFLLAKAEKVPSLELDPYNLIILTREKTLVDGERSSRMRFWDSVKLFDTTSRSSSMNEFWLTSEISEDQEMRIGDANVSFSDRKSRQGVTYHYDTGIGRWTPADIASDLEPLPKAISVSSYNVLVDSDHPAGQDRDPILVETILSDPALADVLVLQEISDDFLSYLLGNDEIRQQYPFASHGPPSQSDVGPLPSLRNVVVLSKWKFTWEFVPFQRRHKGAVVIKIFNAMENAAAGSLPLVIAGIHLTCGLTDGSVAAKKVQLQNTINHLSRNYPVNPWVLAGDFNITTSSYTIREAKKSVSTSAQTEATLHSTDEMLSEAGLLDSWIIAQIEGSSNTSILDADNLYEGEEGATFNPRDNSLAAATSGTSRNRPQRYDRILYRSRDVLGVNRFNVFGHPDGFTPVASDHSGVRTTFKLLEATLSETLNHSEMLAQYTVSQKLAPINLSRDGEIANVLHESQVFPTTQEEEERKRALELIRNVILGKSNNEEPNSSDIPMVLVPVGSYALGVWTSQSDIDCLCIGTISSKTFFRLAIQRLHRNEAQGIRLLRKVQAGTGTMLELSVNGINMDLQYCPAAAVVHRWSEFPGLLPTDSIFNLPILSLRKLKPLRDLNYIQRTTPFKASFHLAYHFIRLWASKRGIYSGKFGFLSGTHITLMLSWVCKRLAHGTGSVSAGDLVVSFFHHYANFDWKDEMVFDAFFHTKKPRYHRSAREPMVVLGYHAPNTNIAHTATMPGLRIISNELKKADARLSEPGITWKTFFETSAGSASGVAIGAGQFLQTHESYVKIDIQYWGRTLSKGRGLVGWIESRCINLVVEIHKALPHLSVRIWPARFAEPNANDTTTYYNGCYLIGLSRSSAPASSPSTEDRAQAKQALEKTLDRFLNQLKSDEKYYDAESCWIDTSLAKPRDVKDMDLDDREWGDYAMEIEPDSDDEEEIEDLGDDAVFNVPRKLPLRGAAQSSVPVSTSKLRPASDVLNRLRWDPNLDPGEYVVGYEDRFLGAREMALGKWKTEQTDLEFIPQHRILYFKKKGDGSEGEIIWERASRVDKIFGSGVGSGDRAAV